MSLIDTFIHCGLWLIGCEPHMSRSGKLAAVIKTLDISPSNLALALVFLEKYNSNSVNSLGSGSAPCYTIISALVVANKYLNDQSYTLKTWQSVLNRQKFDVLLSLLNQLETHFLCALNYLLTTKHDARMWLHYKAFDARHVQQLRNLLSLDDSRTLPLASPLQTMLATPPLQAMQGMTPPECLLLTTRHYASAASYHHVPLTPMSLDFIPAPFLPTPTMSVWNPRKRRRIIANE